MKKIYYYTPIIEPIANNDSGRFGVTLKSKIWQEDSLTKIEVRNSSRLSEVGLFFE